MAKPDLAMITEVILYCNGFTNSDGLALKLVQVFEFAKRQLGDKIHYDFSLRNIKSILDQAGHLRQLVTGMKDPATNNELEEAEQQLEQHLAEVQRVQQELRRQQEQQNDIYMGKAKPRKSRQPSGQSHKTSNTSKSAIDHNKTFENRPAQENADA
jgi:DNA-binding transcriptional MerR regulator